MNQQNEIPKPFEPKIHRLKSWPDQFKDVIAGKKKHEYRENDRDFKIGDTIILKEFDPELCQYTGNSFIVKICYITAGAQFGIPPGYCILSIVPEKRNHFYDILRKRLNFGYDIIHEEVVEKSCPAGDYMKITDVLKIVSLLY